MKSIFFVFLFLLSLSSFAQSPIDKGVYSLGGSISYSSISIVGSDNSIDLFVFNPRFEYFFIKSFAAGISVDYRSISQGAQYDQWGIGPSIRYYFDVEPVIPFLGASYQYGSMQYSNDRATSNIIGFIGGVDFFLSRNVAIEGSLNYRIINEKYPDGFFYSRGERTSKEFLISIGVNVFIF